MMPSGLRTGVIVADNRTFVGPQREEDTDKPLRADELASSATIPESCFEHCSLIRTRCPGPAAQMSVHGDGRWTPICRRTAD
jgi:hypothetical protein